MEIVYGLAELSCLNQSISLLCCFNCVCDLTSLYLFICFKVMVQPCASSIDATIMSA